VLHFGTPRAPTIAQMEIANKQRDSYLGRTLSAREINLLRGAGLPSILIAIFFVVTVMLSGCGYAGAPPTQPSTVLVSIQPTSISLFLGQTQQFQASVTGNANSSVIWLVNGAQGGSTNAGTISASGLYAAPAILLNPASLTVTAASQADARATASAIVSLEDNIVVGVSPASATVSTGGTRPFTASVTGTGNPAAGVTWSVNGIAGGNSTLGTITTSGADTALYTAPATPPSPATVNVTATSVADNSKAASASVTITCSTTNTIWPSAATVALGGPQNFTASFCLAPGATIAWDVNGIAGGGAATGTIVPNGSNTALYTAPADLPSTNPLTIHAVAGTAAASATVTVTSNVIVSVSPLEVSLAVNLRQTFAATVTNTPDGAVIWSVNGVPNGNTTVGQICITGSNPCATPAGPAAGSVDFLAAASVPTTNPVTVTATSHADLSKTGVAMVFVTAPSGNVAVAISPSFAFLPPSGGTLSTQQFFATVTGSTNTGVTWSVQSAIAGQGCGGAACGSVNSSGLYSAPALAPSPNAISVVATSQADGTKSASATIAITSGPAIEIILPSSAMADAVESFPLEVEGVNFVAGSGSAASTILLDGVARGTTCATATSCTTALDPADVQSAGTLTVQVQNPGAPTALSNIVPFVIVPFDVSEAVISLTSADSAAGGENIIVVEPTTVAASAPINVDWFGLLTGGNNCDVQGSPLTITRPSSGSATVNLCIHGNGLDPTFTYAFTGPPGGDIGVTASVITGLFPNTIELDLQISNTTLPGVRTLFITTLNNDRAAATGMLEVK
jgi:hypothetical protein